MRGIFGIHSSKILRTVFMFVSIAVFLPAVLTGCSSSDDEDAMIRVCNTDDEEYYVRLYRDVDNELVDDFRLGEWYDLSDVCDDFEGMADGRYYVTITEVGNSDNIDETDSFYIEEGDYKDFEIKSPGRITGDNAGDDDGMITVCNTDDEEYRVELYRTDGTLADEFELEEWYDVGDVCDEFRNVDEGEYYIIIYEKGTGNSDISDTFFLDGGEVEDFIIESPGEIDKVK